MPRNGWPSSARTETLSLPRAARWILKAPSLDWNQTGQLSSTFQSNFREQPTPGAIRGAGCRRRERFGSDRLQRRFLAVRRQPMAHGRLPITSKIVWIACCRLVYTSESPLGGTVTILRRIYPIYSSNGSSLSTALSFRGVIRKISPTLSGERLVRMRHGPLHRWVLLFSSAGLLSPGLKGAAISSYAISASRSYRSSVRMRLLRSPMIRSRARRRDAR